MWEISKSFNFCYGHRVYTQTTNAEFALNRPPKCRHLHGHEGLVHVHMRGEVQPDGMVTDFCNLGWLKKFIDDAIDHKFIFGMDDPYFSELVESRMVPVYIPDTDVMAAWTLFMDAYKKGTPEYEIHEGYLMVDFIPTSENLSKWLFDLCQVKMAKLGVTVSKVEWWETPKSCSVYKGD